MQLIPLYDGILIKQAEAEEVSTGGIIIPDSVKQAPLKGEVLAVGEGAVYTDHMVFLHVIRKVMLRVATKLNYIVPKLH